MSERVKALDGILEVERMSNRRGPRFKLPERLPEPEDMEPGERLRDVVCPQCKKGFRLRWSEDYQRPTTLSLRGCPSGGIYDVRISCPHCDYEEEL